VRLLEKGKDVVGGGTLDRVELSTLDLADDGDVTVTATLNTVDGLGNPTQESEVLHGAPVPSSQSARSAIGFSSADGLLLVEKHVADDPETLPDESRDEVWLGASKLFDLPVDVGGVKVRELADVAVGPGPRFLAVVRHLDEASGSYLPDVLWYDAEAPTKLRLVTTSGGPIPDRPGFTFGSDDTPAVAVGGVAGPLTAVPVFSAPCTAPDGAPCGGLFRFDPESGAVTTIAVTGDTVDLGGAHGAVKLTGAGIVPGRRAGRGKPVNNAGEVVFGGRFDAGGVDGYAILSTGPTLALPKIDLRVSAKERESSNSGDILVTAENVGAVPAEGFRVTITGMPAADIGFTEGEEFRVDNAHWVRIDDARAAVYECRDRLLVNGDIHADRFLWLSPRHGNDVTLTITLEPLTGEDANPADNTTTLPLAGQDVVPEDQQVDDGCSSASARGSGPWLALVLGALVAIRRKRTARA
jgi:MYXO-CTERM domain-containing protein